MLVYYKHEGYTGHVRREPVAKLGADPEVQKKGRSAVLRRAVEDYLCRRRRFAISKSYRQAYGADKGDPELAGWEDEGVWPDE